MSHSIDPVAARFIPRHHPYVRPIGLLILLVAEAVLFTFRFDAPIRFDQGHWWSVLLQYSHLIFRVILATPIAIGAFGGLRLMVRVRREIELGGVDHQHWSSWLVAHGLALAIFARISLFVFQGNLVASDQAGAWILAWVGSGLLVVATWMSCLFPPEAWLTILRRSRKAVVMGASVTSVALLLGVYTSHRWDSMAGATLALVRVMLSVVSGNVACDPATKMISVDGFGVQIFPGCSGYEGIGLVVAFLSAYLWWFRASMRWPLSYLLLPIGAASIYVLNAVRIAALLLIGAWSSPEVALGAFHSQAGWLAFLGVSLGLVAASRRSSFFAARSDGTAESTVPASNPSASFLGPFLAVLATSMLTSTFATAFDPLYGLRTAVGGLALWHFRRDFAALLQGVSWLGVAIGVVAFGLWVALEPTSTSDGRSLASAVGDLPKGRAWAWIALRIIGSVAIVPLAEELAFRGYLMRRLISVDFQSVSLKQFSWTSLPVSSAAFGLLHGRWLAGLLAGVLYGLALYRRGKLGDAVIAHAVTNGLIAATVLTTGDWTMWT